MASTEYINRVIKAYTEQVAFFEDSVAFWTKRKDTRQANSAKRSLSKARAYLKSANNRATEIALRK